MYISTIVIVVVGLCKIVVAWMYIMYKSYIINLTWIFIISIDIFNSFKFWECKRRVRIMTTVLRFMPTTDSIPIVTSIFI